MGTVSFVDESADFTFERFRFIQFGIVPWEKLTNDMNSNL